MQLKTRDGIACDLCGTIFKRNFEYFSVEYTKVIVNAEQKTITRGETDEKYLNLDICTGCYQRHGRKVKAVAKKLGLA